MVAGLNCLIDVWRMTEQDDDAIGGASISGSQQYTNVRGFIEENKEEQILLQQGLGTLKTFNCTVVPGTLNIYEKDQIEVVYPKWHQYYGNHFRVVNSRKSTQNPRDRRSYILLSLIRNVEAHSELEQ